MDPSYNNSFGGQPVISSGGNSDIVMPTRLPKQQKSKKGLIIGIFIAFVVVIITGLILTSSPKKKDYSEEDKKVAVEMLLQLENDYARLANAYEYIDRNPVENLSYIVDDIDFFIIEKDNLDDINSCLVSVQDDIASIKELNGGVKNAIYDILSQDNLSIIQEPLNNISYNINILNDFYDVFMETSTQQLLDGAAATATCNFDKTIDMSKYSDSPSINDAFNKYKEAYCTVNDMAYSGVDLNNIDTMIPGSSDAKSALIASLKTIEKSVNDYKQIITSVVEEYEGNKDE